MSKFRGRESVQEGTEGSVKFVYQTFRNLGCSVRFAWVKPAAAPVNPFPANCEGQRRRIPWERGLRDKQLWLVKRLQWKQEGLFLKGRAA